MLSITKKDLTFGICIFGVLTTSLFVMSVYNEKFIPSSFKEKIILVPLFSLIIALSLTYAASQSTKNSINQSKKILYKAPLYSLVSIILCGIFFVIAMTLPHVRWVNKEGAAAIVLIILSILSVVLIALCSFLFAVYTYFVKSQTVGKVIQLIVIGIIIIQLSYLIFLFATVPSTIFCHDATCYSKVAIQYNNPSICI